MQETSGHPACLPAQQPSCAPPSSACCYYPPPGLRKTHPGPPSSSACCRWRCRPILLPLLPRPKNTLSPPHLLPPACRHTSGVRMASCAATSPLPAPSTRVPRWPPPKTLRCSASSPGPAPSARQTLGWAAGPAGRGEARRLPWAAKRTPCGHAHVRWAVLACAVLLWQAGRWGRHRGTHLMG